jgi:hypothetical protein
MKTPRLVITSIVLTSVIFLTVRPLARAAEETAPQAAASQRDGQHDFDFNIGTWKTHIRRLVHPLTGSTTWMELNGTVTVRKFGMAGLRSRRLKPMVRTAISKICS